MPIISTVRFNRPAAIVDLVEKKASMLQSVQTLLDSTCVATLNH